MTGTTGDDPILDELLTAEEQTDPAMVEAVKGTFAYQSRALRAAAAEFGSAFSEQVGGAFDRIAERRDRALRRWWKDPR